ncbi:MAG: hypothetical protein KAH22_03765 [Thiotrichaceae bacterium]|nr:hypothetical protein [Thiotrichaceae bacterium]
MFKNNSDDIQKLPVDIENARYQIAEYLKKNEPRQRHLVNFSLLNSLIVIFFLCCAIFFSRSFEQWLPALFSSIKPAWVLLNYIALFFAMLSLLSHFILRGHNSSSQILSARSSDAKLQGLLNSIKNKRISPTQATTIYASYIGELAFILSE